MDTGIPARVGPAPRTGSPKEEKRVIRRECPDMPTRLALRALLSARKGSDA